MKEFIYEKKNSLSEDICNTLIKYFEDNEEFYKKIEIKKKKNFSINTLYINFSDYYTPLKEILLVIRDELIINQNIYFNNLKEKNYIIHDLDKISIKELLIRKYDKKKGCNFYNNECRNNSEKKRFLSFIWYLNDINEGGETEFFGNYIINCSKGKLILFPSEIIFPVCHKIPISDDKYILSGWIYKDII